MVGLDTTARITSCVFPAFCLGFLCFLILFISEHIYSQPRDTSINVLLSDEGLNVVDLKKPIEEVVIPKKQEWTRGKSCEYVISRAKKKRKLWWGWLLVITPISTVIAAGKGDGEEVKWVLMAGFCSVILILAETTRISRAKKQLARFQKQSQSQ